MKELEISILNKINNWLQGSYDQETKKQLNDLEYILEFCAGSGIRTHYIWIS